MPPAPCWDSEPKGLEVPDSKHPFYAELIKSQYWAGYGWLLVGQPLQLEFFADAELSLDEVRVGKGLDFKVVTQFFVAVG